MPYKREKSYQEFEEFVSDLIRDLNQMSDEGWSLLVEGLRDERALRRLGYGGPLVTITRLGRAGAGAFNGVKKVVVLTDLDREGALLASKAVRSLGHEGIRTSLCERRRLKAASMGVFLHIVILSRFAKTDE